MTMTKDFDLAAIMANGGHCVTRDGRKARIICTDHRSALGRKFIAVIDCGEYDVVAASDGSDFLTPPAPKRMVKVDYLVAVIDDNQVLHSRTWRDRGGRPSDAAHPMTDKDQAVAAAVLRQTQAAMESGANMRGIPMSQQWRDIASAPTEVLVIVAADCDGRRQVVPARCYRRWFGITGPYRWETADDGALIWPTHWMPLPDLPESQPAWTA